MKVIYPNFYEKFKCIANLCKHSCCIGWEIDIDEDTLNFYNMLEGDFSKRLKSSVSLKDTPHFILSEGERCPFLNESGLCDIITELGEEALCDICDDHPRFRNYYSGCVEIGLGLCCEAAGELIIKERSPFELIGFDINDDAFSDEEKSLLKIRDKLFEITNNRHLSIKERHEKLLSLMGINSTKMTLSEWCDFYLTLERLDEKWTDILLKLKALEIQDVYKFINKDRETEIENLTNYFIYRYFTSTQIDATPSEFLSFSILSVQIITSLLALNNFDLVEAARMYSSEIEYSDENVLRIIEKLN